MSFLSTFSKDAKAVFTWLSSTKGQTVVSAVEAGVELAVPVSVPAITLINTWMEEAIKVETLASAAGSATGTGTQKASLALSTMTPQVISWASANGYPIPDSTQISAINTAVVNVLNLLGAPATATTTSPVVTPTVAVTTNAVD